MNYEKKTLITHLQLHQKKIPRNKFNQEGERDLYSENKTILVKEIEDTNKWKATPCSWVGRTQNVHSTKAVHRCSAISIKILMAFSTEIK